MTTGTMRVLVVDDNSDILASVEMVLSQAGYQTETCLNASAAIAAHRARPADLLITDLFMPELDGIETIIEFRNQWPDLKIVVMTGGGELSPRVGEELPHFQERLASSVGHYLQLATKAGANAVVRKPVEAAVLLKAVAQATAAAR
jgi:CheY-like chemotaxis protein